MNARYLPSNPNGIYCPAIIQRTINGAVHNFLPAVPMTPALLRVEEALGNAVMLLEKSQAREEEAENLFFDTVHKTHASRRRTTKKEGGQTQHWKLKNGDFEKMASDEFQYELDILGNRLSSAMKAPYSEAGKALVHALRLLMLAAPENVETFAGFKIRHRLSSLDETERLRVFEAYRKYLEATIQKSGCPSGFKATFERFNAVWLNASLQAQTGFIWNMSFRNQRIDGAKKFSYAVIRSEFGSMTHNFLPATPISPKFFRFEKSLSKVFALLTKAIKQAEALRARLSRNRQIEVQRAIRVIIADDGSFQYWLRRPKGDSSSDGEMRIFNGKTFLRSSGNFEAYFCYLAEEIKAQESKLYVAAGLCMADTFRLFENAAQPTLPTLYSHVYEDGFTIALEDERHTMFSNYINVCQQTLMTYQKMNVSHDELTPSFNRLVTGWLSLPAPATSAFILNL